MAADLRQQPPTLEDMKLQTHQRGKSGKRGEDKTFGSSSRKPKPPFPKQHQEAPGLESKLKPAPLYEAPEYLAAGKLKGKTALITGGDSGIGRAVAVLYAREGANLAISYLPEEQEDADETRTTVEAEGSRCLLIPGRSNRRRFL